MANIFKREDTTQPRVKRNAYDMSYQNNLTLGFGKLYPCFVKEVLPGDSWKIKAQFNLNFMPMVFPVQTRMYAKIYFFYCRNRAVWPNWKDFLFDTKDVELPYLQGLSESDFATGSLFDYMNIPTDLQSYRAASGYFLIQKDFLQNFVDYYSDNTVIRDPIIDYNIATSIADFDDAVVGQTYSTFDDVKIHGLYLGRLCDMSLNPLDHHPIDGAPFMDLLPYENGVSTPPSFLTRIAFRFLPDYTGGTGAQDEYFGLFVPCNVSDFDSCHLIIHKVYQSSSSVPETFGCQVYTVTNRGIIRSHTSGHITLSPTATSGVRGIDVDFEFDASLLGEDSIGFFVTFSSLTLAARAFVNGLTYSRPSELATGIYLPDSLVFWRASYPVTGIIYSVDENNVPSSAFFGSMVLSGLNPYIGDEPELHISALPFRHYESIYNCYFRNQKVDPFTIDGVAEYNRYVTNLDDGGDRTKYSLYTIPWESDFLTSALPSPQQGPAPLVGVNAVGQFTFSDGEQSYSFTPTLGPDGDTLTGISAVSDNFPPEALQQLQRQILYGFSINMFRNVNALQHWLETNLIRGYRYRDLMTAHFGEKIHYNELDMPEYLGGVSTVVDMNKVLNTTAGQDVALGDFAGLATAFKGSKHSIRCRCDENGFIIGLIAVTPVPVYSQIMPKFFYKFHHLDFYADEFSKIGYQPIYYSEVSPFQTYADSKLHDISLNSVFGYQRPWYDYLASTDEAHGLFRGQLENFILRRRFGNSPVLSNSFIYIDPNQLNNVFATNEYSDKILGNIWFDATVKRRIPRHHTMGLGA